MLRGWRFLTGSLLGRSVTRVEPCLDPGNLHPVALSSPSQGDSRVRRRLVTGGVAVPMTAMALVTAMAVLAPTGAGASSAHHSDRSAPSKGVTTKPAPHGGVTAARASAA